MKLQCLVLVLIAVTPSVFAAEGEDGAPKQPLDFSHRRHVMDLKQPCKLCHPNLDPGEMMGLPEVSTCMQCHSAIAPKTTAERKLAAFAKQNRDADWVRIYQIPTYVRFDHRQHLAAGAKCETCHGKAAERDRLWLEKGVSMGDCVRCHQASRASLDCASCHEPK